MVTKNDKQPQDLRIKRTFKLLSEALLALLEEKPLDDIDVKDICERAMVHRTTFYKHFEDKYHLMRYCIQRLQDQFNSASLAEYDRKNPRTYYLNLIKQVLHYFREHKRMLLLLINQGKTDSLVIMLHNLISKNIQQKLREEETGGTIFRVPIPILVEYHIGALTSLALWWVKNSMPYSEQQMLGYIDSLLYVDDSLRTR